MAQRKWSMLANKAKNSNKIINSWSASHRKFYLLFAKHWYV